MNGKPFARALKIPDTAARRATVTTVLIAASVFAAPSLYAFLTPASSLRLAVRW